MTDDQRERWLQARGHGGPPPQRLAMARATDVRSWLGVEDPAVPSVRIESTVVDGPRASLGGRVVTYVVGEIGLALCAVEIGRALVRHHADGFVARPSPEDVAAELEAIAAEVRAGGTTF